MLPQPARTFVTYYRVSTQRQGLSGLGLDAQRETVRQFLDGAGAQVVGEFVEVESGRKSEVGRPELRNALALAKARGATLLVAKLDRLSRSVAFVSAMMESKVKFIACDMPEANELTIHILAAVAEHEAKRISQRTKDALAAAKARGVILGAAGPANLRPNIEARQAKARDFAGKVAGIFIGFHARGLSQRQMVSELNSLGLKAPRGGGWSLSQVQATLKRIQVSSASG
ncbi:recombinase family protein [Variovorax sp. LT1P1]|uniref:recombinase family protein n=1 Tax=Variovorax sp. LT1P1 TaxID=3443730 RepID=UPI003F44E493